MACVEYIDDLPKYSSMRRSGELLGVLAQHLLNGSNPGHQTEALEGDVHILPTVCKAGHKRERGRLGNSRHGIACGFDIPSLTAQGGQCIPP